MNSAKISHRQLAAFLLLVVLGLPSCVSKESTPPPRSMGDAASVVNTGNLTRAMRGARSVAIHPRARIAKPYEGRSVEELRRSTEFAILDEFHRRGYAIAPSEVADRWIAYAIGTSVTMADDEVAGVFGLAPGIDTTREIRGGLVLAIVNRHQNSVVWRSSASANTDIPRDVADPRREFASIQKAVKRLLESLPN